MIVTSFVAPDSNQYSPFDSKSIAPPEVLKKLSAITVFAPDAKSIPRARLNATWFFENSTSGIQVIFSQSSPGTASTSRSSVTREVSVLSISTDFTVYSSPFGSRVSGETTRSLSPASIMSSPFAWECMYFTVRTFPFTPRMRR